MAQIREGMHPGEVWKALLLYWRYKDSMKLINGDEVPLALLWLDKQVFQPQELSNCKSVASTSGVNDTSEH